MAKKRKRGRVSKVQKRINESIGILESLGFPEAQLKDRSGLALLALLDLKPDNNWEEATNPLMRITPIMNFAETHYKKVYAPNSREAFRRQTMHQFVEAGLVVQNPDKPDRPINSPQWCYQITPEALELLKTYGKDAWEQKLTDYLAKMPELKKKYADERELVKVSLVFNGDKELKLSAGAHSELIKQIVEIFCPQFTPGAKAVYIGDTGKKYAYFDEKLLEELGVKIEKASKIPDVIVYLEDKKCLVLIESATSHGPVDNKRRGELSKLFENSTVPLVFISAFPNRKTFMDYFLDIAWETEVWTADAPTHMNHFNGSKFLRPC